MNKITIGCKDISNVIEFLKEDFNLVKPYIHYRNGEIIKNFDIFMHFDSTLNGGFDNTLNSILKDVNTFGHRRMGKDEQAIHFNRLNIKHPITYINSIGYELNNRSDVNYLLLRDIPDDKKIILKTINGARGIGQVLLTKDELYKLIDKCSETSLDKSEISIEFDTGGSKSDIKISEDFLVNSIKNKEYILQEKIEVTDEWRYVYFHGGKPMIIKRKVSSDSWQSNSCISGSGNNIILNVSDEDHSEMYRIANKLADDLHVPFLSIDFYKNKDGEIGCFEQQMQFGYMLMSKSELVKNVINSVKSYINQNFEIFKNK